MELAADPAQGGRFAGADLAGDQVDGPEVDGVENPLLHLQQVLSFEDRLQGQVGGKGLLRQTEEGAIAHGAPSIAANDSCPAGHRGRQNLPPSAPDRRWH